jgi:small neutral amino acid transporter SnatA (MarC family)
MSALGQKRTFAPQKVMSALPRKMGVDAITRIVGFFVSAMGVALIFDGVIEALETHGVTTVQ